ncbi:MAG: hypothetical protein Q4A54_08060 [Parabacteroides sp.]|nr:hypothetical protein [Parabacteroides sp.]
MDQMQQSLCLLVKQNPACLTERNILRAALADYLPNNKLKQNLLLNAFDSDVLRNLQKGSDVTLSALTCISQLENDYGITKDAAFWSIQTWCYILGFVAVADALVVLQPTNQAPIQSTPSNRSNGTVYKIGLGIYRAGTDFPAGEVSVQIDTPIKKGEIRATSGKNVKRLSGLVDFKDKIYVTLNEGEYIQLESVFGDIDPPAYTFTVTPI